MPRDAMGRADNDAAKRTVGERPVADIGARVKLRAEVQMFFFLEPEVAGAIGPNSDLHRENGKLVVTRLNYEFDGWLGDALLETTPCFIVTDDARQLIECAALTGVSFSDVEVTRSGLFTDLYGHKTLPHFWWMTVHGEPEADDFGMASDLRLVASERALSTLRQAGLTHAEIEPIGG